MSLKTGQGDMSLGTLRRESVSSKPELQVVGGFHNGVSLALDEGVYSIGSTADADIVLRDSGVASEHALLRIDSHGMRVEAMGGDIGIGDELITQGHGCKLRLPTEIAIGAARLKLSHPGARGTGFFAGPVGQFMSRNPIATAGGVICCALVITVATRQQAPQMNIGEAVVEPKFTLPSTAQAKPELPKTAYHADIGLPGAASSGAVTDVSAQSTVEEAASYLQARLKSVNINSLKVSASDKRVQVVGNLAKRDAPAWISAQQWFDETYSGRVVLTANVAIGENQNVPPLRLQAIWFGERPYILTDEGARFYEGARLESGWMVQRIAEDRIVLERDGESLALTYR
jgi:hypothetical protein